MKFALVNGKKQEATPKKEGICICCGNEVRSYCGLERVHHWKHKQLSQCDSWYESETEWHRNWKNQFDISEQEIIRFDEITGEKHIADVFLQEKNLVIEFQNSPIHINEIKSRELFYKRMIWIVNLIPYFDKIKFHKDIKNDFYYEITVHWARNKDNKINILRKNGEIDKADKLFNDFSDDDYIEYFEKKYKSYSEKENYYLMTWKHQHKRWNFTKLPVFFDVGDDAVYYVIESIKIWNGFVVKRFLKTDFMNYYKTI